jgi:microcystin-dependent protein
MARYYVNEKARFGGVAGTIIPFPQQLPAGNTPDTGNWRKYLPAGFLRCDGSVLSSSEYPVLAEILGTGDNCKFKKDGQDLAANEFALPDLGSKYISGSASSGTFLNSKIENTDSSQGYRVGAEVDISSLVGDTQTITYGGNFELVPFTPKSFIGNPQFKTISSDGNTLNAFLSDQAFQAHGHDATIGVFSYLGNWSDSLFVSNDGAALGGNDAQNEGSNNLVQVQQPTGSSAVVSHSHQVVFPSSSDIADANEMTYQLLEPTVGEIEIDPLGLETTVTITTENIYKLDEATPPYILVEYIIKF